MPKPEVDIVAKDADTITLGDNTFELFNTPGHTTGVLSIRYKVREGDKEYTAMTLGGVGLNFSGVERTQTYIQSYERLQSIQAGTSVSLPNHQAMGDVFARRDLLAARQPGAINPFVNADSYKQDLAKFVAAAKMKLEKEKTGTAPSSLDALVNATTD
jgi:metallo-beta-lactamase class B